jgi:hypothetical protein
MTFCKEELETLGLQDKQNPTSELQTNKKPVLAKQAYTKAQSSHLSQRVYSLSL